ncbi:zinc finger CCCH domain-containing protein 6 [Xenopus laevis]|uniref:Zinc finger CCCH domain-containing protein 6 n=1 Tax=Xenopus laevis TaxID=8355 RepID=A0A8J1MJN7_XENLA|nr:zinc finger CCCH domain-containing protein 6 [Xenopus laevis]
MYRDYDVQYSQHGPGSYITSPKHKKNANDYGGYSNYSDGNYNEEEEDFVEQLKHYRQAKENTNVAELQCERNSARTLGHEQQTDFLMDEDVATRKNLKAVE